MNELPILFKPEMVKAILEGRKTQTRRIIKTPLCPYHIGDILWVRERFRKFGDSFGVHYQFVDEFRDPHKYKWRPSIHMPREAARIFLEIKSISVERLQKIGLKDVLAEGIEHHELKNIPKRSDRPDLTDDEFKGVENWILSYARFEFEKLWDSINSKRGHPWRSNPWVWVIEFKRIEK